MKATILFGMMCAFGSLGSVAYAADTAEAGVAQKIAAYSVSFSGGGWGASNKARAALKKMSGVDKVLVSGTNAIVVPAASAEEIKKADVRKAFSAAGLKLEKLSKADFDKPTVGYRFVGSGGGWATTNERARVALTKLDGVSFAFVESKSVEVLLGDEGSYDKEAIEKVLKRAKFKVSEASKMESLPL